MLVKLVLETKQKPFNPRTIGIRVLGVLNHYASAVRKDYEAIFETWNVHKPAIYIQRRYRGATPLVTVRPVHSIEDVYNYITNGTEVRYAHMTSDFVPKTTPGVLRSFSGAGGLAYINRNRPIIPGITARAYEFWIVMKHMDNFTRDVRNAIIRGIAADVAGRQQGGK